MTLRFVVFGGSSLSWFPLMLSFCILSTRHSIDFHKLTSMSHARFLPVSVFAWGLFLFHRIPRDLSLSVFFSCLLEFRK